MALSRRRVVVVGLGSIGRRHARLLRERNDVDVQVAEPDEAARLSLMAELGAALPQYPSFEAALASSPDIVWICTPTCLHAEQAIAALEAGVHVFCEKPMADGLAAARRMKQSADRTSGILNIGFHLHFWDAMQSLKQRLAAGDLGQLLHAHARVGTYVTLVNSVSRYQASTPGSLFYDYSHQPDLLYWLTGLTPRAVVATGFQSGALDLTSNPNIADIVCMYDAPMTTTIHLNYVQMPQRHCYELVGDEAWALLDFEAREMIFGSRARQSTEVLSFPQERDDMFRAEHRAFFAAVDGERVPETPATDGLVSTAVCDAIVESWRSRRMVNVTL